MATEIASLFATIGANSEPLRKALLEAARMLDDVNGRFAQAGEASKKFDSSIKVGGASLKQWGTAAGAAMGVITASAAAMKAAFDFTEQGAMIAQTTASFDRLGVSMKSMRDASLGTIDDMTLMSSTLALVAGASEGMQGHLLGAAPQLMEIAKAASALNPHLGDTAHMYESVALGIKRGSPMILDNLGIIVKVGEANEKYAAILGKSVEALSAKEKQVALLNATLEAGTRLVEQNGGVLDSTTDAWAFLRAEIKNTTDEAKAHAAEGVQPIIQRYGEFLKLTRENDQSLVGFGSTVRLASYMLTGNADVMERSAAGYEDYGKALQMARAYGIPAAEVIDLNTRAMRAGAEASTDYADAMMNGAQRISSAINDSGKAFDQYNAAIAESERQSASALQSNIDRMDRWAEVTSRNLIPDLQALSMVMSGPLASETESYTQQQAELTERAAELNTELEKLQRSHGTLVTTTSAAALSENELNLATLQYQDTLGKMSEEDDPLKLAKLQVQADGLAAKIGGAATSVETFVNNAGRIGEIEGELADVNAAFEDNAAAHEEATRRILFGILEQRIAISTMADDPAAMNALFELANQWGLIDDATLDAVQTFDGYVTAVENGKMSLDSLVIRTIEYDRRLQGLSKSHDFNFNWHWVEMGNRPNFADPNNKGMPAIPMAGGGDFMVNRPTLFLAGEAGPERATFTPLGGGAGGAGDGAAVNIGSIVIQAASDPQATARAVIQEMGRRGVQLGGAFR